MPYSGRTSLCPRNYYPPGTGELMGRVVSFTTKKEGKRGRKSKADRLLLLPGEAGARPGASAEVPKCQEASVASAPAGNAATKQDHRHPHLCPPGTARDGVPEPAPAGPAPLSPPPLSARRRARAWTPFFSLPGSRTGHRADASATAPGEAGEAKPLGRRAGKALGAVPHLRVEKGHTARFGIVLIRAVRHLGVKSLLPLHAGRKRFSLAGLGKAEGER